MTLAACSGQARIVKIDVTSKLWTLFCFSVAIYGTKKTQTNTTNVLMVFILLRVVNKLFFFTKFNFYEYIICIGVFTSPERVCWFFPRTTFRTVTDTNQILWFIVSYDLESKWLLKCLSLNKVSTRDITYRKDWKCEIIEARFFVSGSKYLNVLKSSQQNPSWGKKQSRPFFKIRPFSSHFFFRPTAP